MSPEMLCSEFESNFKQDVWATGVTSFLLCYKGAEDSDSNNYDEIDCFPFKIADITDIYNREMKQLKSQKRSAKEIQAFKEKFISQTNFWFKIQNDK